MATGEEAASDRVWIAYLLAQAGVGVLWWLGMVGSPTVRSWFEMQPDRHAVLDAFIFGDLVVIIAGSLTAAWGLRRGASWTLPVVAFTAGGLVYPTLYLLAWVSYTGRGAGSLFAMVVPSTVTTLLAVSLARRRRRPPVGASRSPAPAASSRSSRPSR